MPATFKVVGSLVLRSRKQLIVFGDLIDGESHRGMVLAGPAGSNLQVSGHVDSIEHVDFLSLRAGCPALVLHSETPQELDTWREVSTEGLVLSLQ